MSQDLSIKANLDELVQTSLILLDSTDKGHLSVPDT